MNRPTKEGTNPPRINRAMAHTGPFALLTKLTVGTWNSASGPQKTRKDNPNVRVKKITACLNAVLLSILCS
jgi:hypothetical protein